jgi:hypothetical protein
MPSAKYIGYLGGAAVAAGVGAAIAVAGQGTAHADTESTSASTASESTDTKTTKVGKTDKVEKVEKPEQTDGEDAGTTKPSRSDRPKFDPAEAVKELTKQFGLAKPTKVDDETDADDDDGAPTEEVDEPEKPDNSNDNTDSNDVPAAEAPVHVWNPVGDLATKAHEVVAALTKPTAPSPQVTAEVDTHDNTSQAAAGPVPWSINPFRPMPPEPAPNDMPGVLWDIEQTVVNAFAPAPFLQPFVREGFEAAFRGSQFIPFVNAVIPAANIIGQVPNLGSGDPVVFRNATQSIINNLIVTLHPVSVLYYGYDEIADFINLEYEAQQLKEVFYATTWDILDPFALLHNRGQSGLPLSPSSPSQTVDTQVQLAAATVDAPGSNDPLRADDPNPVGMPAPLLQARDLVMLFLPSPVREVYREGFELVYRASQVVPVVNMVVPITEIVPAVLRALTGDKAGAQIAINQLILTTGPVSALYYGYDQIADLLNTEEASFAAKQQLYITVWDTIDPNFVLHHQGQSGLVTV